ncbi:MAG: TRAP transporter small permease subunit [Alphaproteobacteria bacterium]|nr:MAG: TRAP transporter small permease subunit [Alphaproteobacteria bacterium]
MGMLLTLSQWLEGASSLVGRMGAWLMLALMAVIMGDVTLRHFFVIGSTKLQELEWHLHGALFLLVLGWAYSRGAHVRIELVSERLSARAQAWIELLGCLVFLIPYVIAILHFGYDYMSYAINYHEASASPTGLPDRWIIKSMILVGFFFLGLAALSRVCQALVFLFGPAEQSAQTVFAEKHEQEGAS